MVARMCWMGLFLILLGDGLAAAPPAKTATAPRLGVDIVTLKSGKIIRGVVVKNEGRSSLTMVVPRVWLQQANVELSTRLSQDETTAQRVAWEQLRQRLTSWLANPSKSARLIVFVKNELERIEKRMAHSEPSEPRQFVWFDPQRETIAKVSLSSVDRRQIAFWAWSERLNDVEQRDVAHLTKELKQRGVDPTTLPPDLSQEFAARPQDDREWSARWALVQYSLGTKLDFQGTGGMLVRSDSTSELKELVPVIAQVLRGPFDSLFKDFTRDNDPTHDYEPSGNDWLRSAMREADRLESPGFRATQVELHLETHQAAVQSVFAVRMIEGTWETVWSARETADATTIRSDLESRIADDPQIQKMRKTLISTGLGLEHPLQEAIRFGAATMAAQQTVDSRFFEFRDRYINHMDGPPLWWKKQIVD